MIEKPKPEEWQLEIAYKHGLMDATKHIREVYKKYYVLNGLKMDITKECAISTMVDLWQAIKQDLEF